MPPKKSGNTQPPAPHPSQLVTIQIAQIKSLEQLVAQRQAENVRLKETLALISKNSEQQRNQHSKELNDRFDITSDMTRQFKAMQDELLRDIGERERGLESIRAEGARESIRLKNEIREKEELISKKEQEILDLKSRLDKLSKEFSTVLKNTLQSVGQKIEEQQSQQQQV